MNATNLSYVGSTTPQPINLNGGAISYTTPTNNYFRWGGLVTANAASIININPTGPFGTPGNNNGSLYFDGGLAGGAPITVNAMGVQGFGLVLRNTSTYSGTMTVNGTISATPGTGSGLVIGDNPANATLPNANITDNGTIELGNDSAGMGWAGANTVGQTFQMNSLNGTGVIVANYASGATTGARTLSVGNNNGSGSFSGVIAVSPVAGNLITLAFIKNGTGTEILSGANTYTGTTTVNGGTLQLNATTATPNVLASTTALTLGGGTLSLQGSLSGAVNQLVASLALTAGTSNTIILADSGSTTGTSLTAGGTFTNPALASGTTLYLNEATAGTGVLQLGTTTTTAFAPWAVVNNAGVTGFGTVNANHDLVLATGTPLTSTSNTNSVNYTTTPTDPAYSSGTLTMTAADGALNSLFINSGSGAAGTLALNGATVSLASDVLGMGGSSNYTISGAGGLTATSTSTLLTVTQIGSGTLSINSLINAAGTGGLTLAGGGTLVLGAANTYGGTTTVDAGTLQLGSSPAGSIKSGNALTTLAGATFDINGNGQTLGTVTNAGTITSSIGSPTLTIGNGSTGAGSWTGAMSVAMSAVATNSAFSGNWTNTGSVSLATTAAGTITVSGAVANVGGLSLSTGATAAGTITMSGPISNTGRRFVHHQRRPDYRERRYHQHRQYHAQLEQHGHDHVERVGQQCRFDQQFKQQLGRRRDRQRD